MPDVKKDESRDDYMSRCVPQVMKEGLTEDQAVGKCEGMYDEHKHTFRNDRIKEGAERYGRTVR